MRVGKKDKTYDNFINKIGAYALPGGMVDPSDANAFAKTALREFAEEATSSSESITMDVVKEALTKPSSYVLSSYVDDPRNSRNAWMETSVYVGVVTNPLEDLQGNDDALDAGWKDVEGLNLYASHNKLLEAAIEKSGIDDDDDVAKSILSSLFGRLKKKKASLGNRPKKASRGNRPTKLLIVRSGGVRVDDISMFVASSLPKFQDRISEEFPVVYLFMNSSEGKVLDLPRVVSESEIVRLKDLKNMIAVNGVSREDVISVLMNEIGTSETLARITADTVIYCDTTN
jgi:8-oxo-dGTP pyrophosphatase MutT (NUDIX family)